LIPSPAGRHRRANNPSSLAQHRIKKRYLHHAPLNVRDTRGLEPPPTGRLRRATTFISHAAPRPARHLPTSTSLSALVAHPMSRTGRYLPPAIEGASPSFPTSSGSSPRWSSTDLAGKSRE
jgi:hypothetical protein